MNSQIAFALGLVCISQVSGFFQGGSIALRQSPTFGKSSTRLAARKANVVARFQDDMIDRRSLLIASILASVPVSKKAVAADSEAQFTAALLELSNQVPYDDRAVAFFSDGNPLFKPAQAAFANLGGTVVNIDPKKSVEEIQKLYKEGNCIGAFVPDEKTLKAIMQGPGCECERYFIEIADRT